jgi:hypothetical protein
LPGQLVGHALEVARFGGVLTAVVVVLRHGFSLAEAIAGAALVTADVGKNTMDGDRHVVHIESRHARAQKGVPMRKNEKKARENKAGDRKAKVKKVLKEIASQLSVIVAARPPTY